MLLQASREYFPPEFKIRLVLEYDPATLSITAGQGKYEEAEQLYKRSLAIDEKVYGPDDPKVATDPNNRGVVEHMLLRFSSHDHISFAPFRRIRGQR